MEIDNFPKYLSIQTTSLCNGHCIFCPYDQIKDLFPMKIMEEHLFKKIINECSQYHSIERIILYLNNEPLTDPHLIGRINYVKEKIPWASVHILTNGSLLTKKISQDLIDSKLDWIGFSLHGIKKQTFQRCMGLNYDLTFKRVLNFIKEAKSKRDIQDFIMVTFLRHKYLTQKEADETIKFWRDKGIERISYFEGPISRAGNVRDLPKVRHEKIKGCTSIWANEMIHIVENGDVVLCCMDWRREIILGNINKQSIYEVWNSQYYEDTRDKRDGRKESPDNFICKRCEAAMSSLPSEPLIKKTVKGKTKKLDILLAICPVWGTDMPPLGLAYITSYLKSKKINLEVLDFNINIFNNVDVSLKKFWEMSYAENWDDFSFFNKIKDKFEQEIEYCVNKILSFDCDLIAFSVYAPNRFFSIEVMKRIKHRNPQKIIVAGGRGVATAHERKIFPEGVVDYFFIGEGEEPLVSFIQRLRDKQDFENLAGAISFQNRFLNLDPYMTKDINNLPYPTYIEFNLSKYKEKSLPLLMSRGCIFHCAFCDDWRLMGKYRSRSAERLIEEIRHHIKKYKITNFYFNDPAINGNLNELERLCNSMIQNNLNITWIGLAIPFNKMTLGLLKNMHKAGCLTLNYGIESGSNKILKLMKKLINIEQVEQILKDTRQAGINTQVNFIIGFPGEGEKEFQETVEFIKRNKEYISGVTNINICNATLGSDLSYNCQKYGIIFPKDDLLRDSHWESPGNTYQIRKDRALKAMKILKQLNIPIFTTNVFAKERQDKLDVLLVTLPPWGIENPPLGLGYLDSYIRDKGLRCQVYDFNIYFYNSTEDYKMLWHVENKNYWSNQKTFPLICELFKAQIDYAVNKILSTDTDLIGFSVVDPKERLTIEVIKRLKDKASDKKIILGGPACSTEEQRNFFTDSIPGYIDYFVVGEGEETLYEIIRRERDALNKDNPLGVAIKVNSKWQYKPRQPINPIDAISFPNYGGFDLSQYNGGKSLLVERSRGCIGRCSFCKNYSLVPGYRARSPESIIRELSFIINQYGIREFTVCDPLMNGDIKQLSMICEKVIKNNFNMKWSGQIAPRKEMDYGLFTKMRKAGCDKIQIGVESGSDKVLRNMRKIYTTRVACENIRAAKRAGIEVEVFIMIGFPGEGEKEFKETFKFIKDNAPYIDTVKSINTLHLIAGTDVYESYQRYNLKPLPKRNWHYLWETYDGNDYKVRKERTQRLLDLTYDLGLRVMEANIKEGKEELLLEVSTESLSEQLKRLMIEINHLQELPKGKPKVRILKKKHSLFKFILLSFIFIYVLFYITYFWIFKKLKGKTLLGGN